MKQEYYFTQTTQSKDELKLKAEYLGRENINQWGITKKEYMATRILQGLISGNEYSNPSLRGDDNFYVEKALTLTNLLLEKLIENK
jgi:hypothetical protein